MAELFSGVTVLLNLWSCKKLRKLPEHIGNMEGLMTFRANNTAIEQLPDSFGDLINLEDLYLGGCENLRNLPNSIWKLKSLITLNLIKCSNLVKLPEQLGEMQCLEDLYASRTAIEQVPDSIGLLSRLQRLGLDDCKKLKYVPESIWNLTSIKELHLKPGAIGRNSLPDSVKNMKNIKVLKLRCNVVPEPFIAHLPNGEVAEWFDYKTSGHTVSFDIPPSFGSNSLGLGLWVVYTCKPADEIDTYVRAVITNNTECTTKKQFIRVHTVGGEALSSVQCIKGEKISMTSGDRIKVSISSVLYSLYDKVLIGEVKVKMFGVHVIQKRPPTSV